MRETFRLWKEIFSKPKEGFSRMTPYTRLGIPIAAILLVLLVAGFLIIPVATSDAYRSASSRAYRDFLSKSGMYADPEAAQSAAAELESPVGRSIQLMNLVAGPMFRFLFAAVIAAGFIWLAGFALRSRIRFGTALRVFVFCWAVFAWQALLTGIVLLLSDYGMALDHVNTLTALHFVLSVPFSLSIVFPPGFLSPLPLLVIDFSTNIFHIVFYWLLGVGIRAQSENPATWKTAVAVGGVALIHFLSIAVFVILR
ncbi:MAG: hypothetical protein JXD23_09075 [Spirochaetales bacterium]|nr:hypothetical protein [Spirochaetales bacterium]